METSDPKAIRRAVWAGSIPCKILLDPGESRVFDASDPYYVCPTITPPPLSNTHIHPFPYLLTHLQRQIIIPRIAYLPFFAERVCSFFRPFVIDPEVAKPESAWFEFESVPMKWLVRPFVQYFPPLAYRADCEFSGTGLLVFCMTCLPDVIRLLIMLKRTTSICSPGH